MAGCGLRPNSHRRPPENSKRRDRARNHEGSPWYSEDLQVFDQAPMATPPIPTEDQVSPHFAKLRIYSGEKKHPHFTFTAAQLWLVSRKPSLLDSRGSSCAVL